MDHLDHLENRSIFLLREAYAKLKDVCMLWSVGKDSTVMLWLARKAFLGHVPFPLVHIDTRYKIPEMIEYRDRLTREWKLNMVYGENTQALEAHRTFPDGQVDRLSCCRQLKTEPLKHVVNATGPRYRFDHTLDRYVIEENSQPYSGVIVGVRADEEGSRSKDRYFSIRDRNSVWDIADQPPEFWDHFNTEVAQAEHIRVHPLLDWTELNIWEYIDREKIRTVSLYYDQGQGRRYRSLGCYPCTAPVLSNARNPAQIVEELKTGKFARVAERAGRSQDTDDGGGLETLRRGGYM